jgi:nucleoside-diphosphate-sugar epimerase
VNILGKSQQVSVIIFGANGFLGSLITRKLHGSGFVVLPVIRPGANKSRLDKLVDLKVLEVETTEWQKMIPKYNPNAIICAQWSGVSKKDRNSFEIQDKNIEPIMNLAIAAKESNVSTFICFGSQAEVKESTESIEEVFYNSSTYAYGVVKSKLHFQLKSLFEGSNSRFVWARVFSVYGPSDFSDSLLVKLFESEISGTEFTISNPSKFWSYLYEDDFASAMEQILENIKISGCVNVGNPIFNQIRDIVAIWDESLTYEPHHFEFNQANSGLFPRMGKLSSIGWKPAVSLSEGVQRTRTAFRKQI